MNRDGKKTVALLPSDADYFSERDYLDHIDNGDLVRSICHSSFNLPISNQTSFLLTSPLHHSDDWVTFFSL